MSVTLTFLGTSDSQGVPRIICDCEVCSKNTEPIIRTRPSLYVEFEHENLMIDTSPDFRLQLLREGLPLPNTLLFTHAHNDHIAGFGDFLDVSNRQKGNISITTPAEVLEDLYIKYPYGRKRDNLSYHAAIKSNIDGWNIKFVKVNHGRNGHSYGIRFSKDEYSWAYISDSIHLTETEKSEFYDLDLLILGTSFWYEQDKPTRSVYCALEGIELAKELRVKQAIFTHLSHDINPKLHKLPENIGFAYDGLKCIL